FAMFKNYSLDSRFYDEMLQGDQLPRQHYEALFKQISQFPLEEIKSRHELAQLSFLREGITFTVYNDEQGTERTMPFDFVPKVIPNDEWLMIEKGLIQRVKA